MPLGLYRTLASRGPDALELCDCRTPGTETPQYPQDSGVQILTSANRREPFSSVSMIRFFLTMILISPHDINPTVAPDESALVESHRTLDFPQKVLAHSSAV